MQPRTCRIDLATLALTFLAPLSACGTDLVGPERATGASRWSASVSDARSRSPSSRRKVFRGPRGTYVLDLDSLTLRDERGKTASLPRTTADAMARVFDNFAKAQRVADRLTASPQYARTIAKYASSKHRVRVSLGAPPATASSFTLGAVPLSPVRLSAQNASLASVMPSRPSSVDEIFRPRGATAGSPVATSPRLRPQAVTRDLDYSTGSDYCTELELAIYDNTQKLNELSSFWDYLLTIAMGSVKVNPDELFVFTPEGFFISLGAAMLQTSQQIATIETTLDVLAGLYSAYGCWGQSGDGSTSLEDSGGEIASSSDSGACEEEWVVLEISYDDGATWEYYWSGTATVCDYTQ